MEKLTSRSNEKIRFASLLRSSASKRRQSGCFFLEGARLCSDAAASGVVTETLFLTEKALEKYGDMLAELIDGAQAVFLIADGLCGALSDTVMPQGVFCVCKTPPESGHIIDKNGKYIALDNVQNPDNVGVISRTAEAMGLSGVIVAGGCDIYNPKAQRAAAGSLLRMPVIKAVSLPETLTECAQSGMLTLALLPDSTVHSITGLDLSRGAVCVVGNEGAGISEEVVKACEINVTIPMAGRTESLNAAVAAAIAMWELTRR